MKKLSLILALAGLTVGASAAPEKAAKAATVLGDTVYRKFPFAGATRPMDTDLAELVLNRTWRPMLSVTGAAGLPAPANAGNVLRPQTQLVLSLRIPPTLAAWAPSGIATLLGVSMLFHLEDG